MKRKSATEPELRQFSMMVAQGLQAALDDVAKEHGWKPLRFALLLFEPGPPGAHVVYVSTAERPGTLAAIRQVLRDMSKETA